MRKNARHGRIGSCRGFTLVELLKKAESDTLPTGDESAVTES
jgi:hypothetical protein